MDPQYKRFGILLKILFSCSMISFSDAIGLKEDLKTCNQNYASFNNNFLLRYTEEFRV